MPVPTYSPGDSVTWSGTNPDSAGFGYGSAYYIVNPGTMMVVTPYYLVAWDNGSYSVFAYSDPARHASADATTPMTLRQRLAQIESEQTRDDYRAVVRAVADCPERGASLPHTRQREGCANCELYECRAGVNGGEVTTADCIACCCRTMGVTT